MENREFDTRYDYSCRCGWIDWAHAATWQHETLIEQVTRERSKNNFDNRLDYFFNGDPAFLIHYGFQSGKGLSFDRHWVIKKGLSIQEKNSVMLAIFEAAGRELEDWQGTFIPRQFSNSSYSIEDLVSNKIAFYMTLNKISRDNVSKICGIVSRDKAFDVYVYMNKTFGGLGAVKNKESTPVNFNAECDECKGIHFGLPNEFDSIKPIEHGTLWAKANPFYFGAPMFRSEKDIHFFSDGSCRDLPKKKF